MPSMINTNIASLNAQNNLTKSQMTLTTSLQRLSTGLRINSAKDDSAGLAIAAKMSAQIGGLNQATRNANDGISMSQTAEGAMGQVGDILLRMRDLSVQAANGTNSADDRKTIQNEVDQLYSEIDRISATTEFNGNKLLNGTSTNNSFQVGANANQTISFKISEVSTKAMALNSTSGLGDLNSGRVGSTTPASGSSELQINGKGVAMLTTDVTAKLQAVAINKVTGTTGVSATAYNSLQGTAGANGVTSGALTIQVGSATAVTIDASSSMNDLVDKINKQVGGVTASIGTNGGLSLTNDDGSNIVIGGTMDGSGLTAGTYKGYLSLKSGDGSAISLSTATGTNPNKLNAFGFNATTGNSVVDSASTLTGTTSSDAAAVTALNTAQGKLTTTDNVKINGVSLGVTGVSAAEKATAINAVSDKTGVTATAKTTLYATLSLNPSAASASSININGTAVAIATTDLDTAAVVAKINAAGISGITASSDADTGRLVLTSSSGNDIVISNPAAPKVIAGVADSATATVTALGASESIAIRGKVTLSGEDGASIRLTEGVSGSLAKLGLVEQGGNDEAIGGKLSVTTQANAQSAITRIDKAISFVSTQRSTMGAIQNRLSSAISNLTTSSENITAARSRIQDADFASETATMTRSQILQQAGTAMLAQANSLPNGVLSLLRG
jgi:flagellin